MMQAALYARPSARRHAAMPSHGRLPFGNSTARLRARGLGVLAGFPPDAFELVPQRFEGIAQRHVHILVRVLLAVLPGDDPIAVRERDVDVNLVNVALVPMVVGRIDDDLKAFDLRIESLQPMSELVYSHLERRGRGHVAEGDFQRNLHGCIPLLMTDGSVSEHPDPPEAIRACHTMLGSCGA
jgi:hypothetical protein